VLSLGPGSGALVLRAPASLEGRQLEIRSVDDAVLVHTVVRRWPGGGGPVAAAVFCELAPGTYRLAQGHRGPAFEVGAGRVTEAAVDGAGCGPSPGGGPSGMDIEEFYAADPRRRASAEVELGQDWLDESGRRFELSWVEATGELYLMSEPVEPAVEDPLGDVFVHLPTREVRVKVLARVPDRLELERLLAGWQDQMGRPGGLGWLSGRLVAAGHPPVSASDL